MKTKAHQIYKLASGEIVPGVTTALGVLAKPALVPWANKLGLAGIDVRKYVDDKADIGTLAHKMVEAHIMGKEADTADYSKNQIDRAENSVLSYLEWEKAHPIIKVYFVEKQLVSETHKFGGTEDIYCMIQGDQDDYRELIDLKTGNGIYEESVYQVAALKHLLEENGFRVDRARILNIPRNEDEAFTEKVLSDRELDFGWEIFLHALGICQNKKEMKAGNQKKKKEEENHE
jgi:hypothetical protein